VVLQSCKTPRLSEVCPAAPCPQPDWGLGSGAKPSKIASQYLSFELGQDSNRLSVKEPECVG